MGKGKQVTKGKQNGRQFQGPTSSPNCHYYKSSCIQTNSFVGVDHVVDEVVSGHNQEQCILPHPYSH